MQTANPDYLGGDSTTIGFGINWLGLKSSPKGHRIALEYLVPIEQDRNGVQMEMGDMLTFGYQKAF